MGKSYFLSKQRPSFQDLLGFVLLSGGQQRLEELCGLRRENLEGAGVEELTGALWQQAYNSSSRTHDGQKAPFLPQQRNSSDVSVFDLDSLCL